MSRCNARRAVPLRSCSTTKTPRARATTRLPTCPAPAEPCLGARCLRVPVRPACRKAGRVANARARQCRHERGADADVAGLRCSASGTRGRSRAARQQHGEADHERGRRAASVDVQGRRSHGREGDAGGGSLARSRPSSEEQRSIRWTRRRSHACSSACRRTSASGSADCSRARSGSIASSTCGRRRTSRVLATA